MSKQLRLLADEAGTEGSLPAKSARSEYRAALGRNNPARNWRRRMGEFEAGHRPEPAGFGGLEDRYPPIPGRGIDVDTVPMAPQEAQDSYWSENIHPGSEAARNRAAMANIDAPVPQGPLKWPREHSREFVNPASLSTVQFEGVRPSHVANLRGKNASVPPIQVEEHAGEPVVVDGNHRVAAGLIDGALFTEADVYRPKMGPHRVMHDEEGGRYYEDRGY